MQLARDDWHEERIGGRLTQVFERRLAVFPRQTGDLTLGPLTHVLTTSSGAAVRIEAAAVTRAVAPYPAGGRPLTASALTVVDDLSAEPGRLRDGETVTRRVTITARGTLSTQLPERPPMRERWLISLAAPETRETRAMPEGPITTITWEWQLRPKTGEPGVLPEIAIPWFDTTTRRMQTAIIPAIPFGYASFGANIAGGGGVPLWQMAGVMLAVTAATLLWLLSGMALVPWTNLRRWFLRWLPDPTLPPLRAAADTGDLIALRRALEAHLARRASLGQPAATEAVARLDAAIYAENAERPDGRAWLRAFRSEARLRAK